MKKQGTKKKRRVWFSQQLTYDQHISTSTVRFLIERWVIEFELEQHHDHVWRVSGWAAL